MKTSLRFIGIVLLSFPLVFKVPRAVSGHDLFMPNVASYVVNTFVDELDLSGSGTGCSLREAIVSAGLGSGTGGCVNNGGTPPTIYVPSGTYLLDFGPAGSRPNEDGGTIGDLDIYVDMSIFGDGNNETIIDGVNTDRVFDILAGYEHTVTLNDMKIINGNPGSGNGGAIRNNANLDLYNVRIESNQAGGHGGGIYHKTGLPPASPPRFAGNPRLVEGPMEVYSILTLENSIIGSNKANGFGGGIHNETGSGMVLSRVTMYSNLADYDLNGNGGGGGVYNLSEMDVTLDTVIMAGNNSGHAPGGGFYSSNSGGDSVIIRDSIFSANTTSSYGGNIVHGSDGVFEVYRSDIIFGAASSGAGFYGNGDSYFENCTFSDNVSAENGGAIYVGLGVVEIIHATMANNIGAMGAGIYSQGSVLLKSSILASNRTSGGSLSNCISSTPPLNFTSSGYNITDGASCAAPMTGDLAHTDPRLGAFDRHGSANNSWSYALQHGSPAIDAADPVAGPLVDQRGVSRPYPTGGVRDVGAYESNVSWWFLPIIMK